MSKKSYPRVENGEVIYAPPTDKKTTKKKTTKGGKGAGKKTGKKSE